jgi:hypothetical protein
MSRTNGETVVLDNGSAVVDDFELIRRKSAPKRSKLDDVSDTLRRAQRSLNALEVIKTNYAACGPADDAISFLSGYIEGGALASIARSVSSHL